MKLNESVLVTKRHSAWRPFCLFFLLFFMLVRLDSSFEGQAVRISIAYWLSISPVAIPIAIITAWAFKRALVGSWYRRYKTLDQQMSSVESWVAGILAAAILVLFGGLTFANLLNHLFGTPYEATYKVTSIYVTRGKNTCYGLTLTRLDDPLDQFNTCVASAEQYVSNIGDLVRVTGRRSRYVNQMLSHAIIR